MESASPAGGGGILRLTGCPRLGRLPAIADAGAYSCTGASRRPPCLPVAAPPHREGGARRCPPPPPLTVWMQRERGGATVGAPPHQLLASCGGGGLSADSALPHRAMLDVSARPQHHRVCLGDGGHMGGKGGIAREGTCSLNVLLSHWRSAGAILWNTPLWKTTVTMQAARGDDGGCVESLNAVRVMLRPYSSGWRRVSFVVKNNG